MNVLSGGSIFNGDNQSSLEEQETATRTRWNEKSAAVVEQGTLFKKIGTHHIREAQDLLYEQVKRERDARRQVAVADGRWCGSVMRDGRWRWRTAGGAAGGRRQVA